MRKFIAAMTLFLASHGVSDTRIIGGDTVTQSQEFMVTLFKKGRFNYFFSCGGSLLDNEWILTAAHCVDQDEPEDLAVVVGELLPFESSAELQLISEVIVHPNYVGSDTDYDFDIALLRLAAPISNESLDIASSDLPTGTDLTVMGWGSTDLEDYSESLQSVIVEVVSQSTCEHQYTVEIDGSLVELISDNMMCAADTNKDSCSGDSGGPLMIQSEGQYFQVGIVSWGFGCADEDFSGVYIRVDRFLDWINSYKTERESLIQVDVQNSDGGSSKGAITWLTLVACLAFCRRKAR
mgnify:CR=1 FL=1